MVSIRQMAIEDYELVYDLWIHTPGTGLNTADDNKEGIARYLKRNPTTCFVAESGDKVVGALLAGHDGRRGYLYHAAVLPEFQRQGIARALVAHAMEALEREGIHKAALVVFQRNAAGNAFWEKIDFSSRDDLVYRNKSIHALTRIDT